MKSFHKNLIDREGFLLEASNSEQSFDIKLWYKEKGLFWFRISHTNTYFQLDIFEANLIYHKWHKLKYKRYKSFDNMY